MSADSAVDTAPIVAEIASARADMAVSLEAVADRLSPKKLLDRAKLRLRAKVEDLKVRLNPVHIVQRKLGAGDEVRPAITAGGSGSTSQARQLPPGR